MIQITFYIIVLFNSCYTYKTAHFYKYGVMPCCNNINMIQNVPNHDPALQRDISCDAISSSEGEIGHVNGPHINHSKQNGTIMP